MSARILCVNKADPFFFNDPAAHETTKDFLRTVTHAGYEGKVLRSWSATPVACFERGNRAASQASGASHI